CSHGQTILDMLQLLLPEKHVKYVSGRIDASAFSCTLSIATHLGDHLILRIKKQEKGNVSSDDGSLQNFKLTIQAFDVRALVALHAAIGARYLDFLSLVPSNNAERILSSATAWKESLLKTFSSMSQESHHGEALAQMRSTLFDI